MNEVSHFPYDGLVNVSDKISVLVKRLHSYAKDDFLGDVVAYHLALEISEQRDLYNFLMSDNANSTLEYFGIQVRNGRIVFKEVSISLIAPPEEDFESIFKGVVCN